MTSPGGPDRALESFVLVGAPRVTDRCEGYERNSPRQDAQSSRVSCTRTRWPADESEKVPGPPRAGHGQPERVTVRAGACALALAVDLRGVADLAAMQRGGLRL
ncbi:hypothetical protein DL767_003264 [Monosporascus sp. MG133]|nr:hypothetical protein DL767_003264 [Monosporascus sp. MG133]